jgi:uncharacterized protein YrrD
VTLLVRATELEGRPVVTWGGERVAEIKDTVFDSARGRVIGFTLRGPGLLSRVLGESLPWKRVEALGRDAVMIRDESALTGREDLVADGVPDERNVLGNEVLTDTGIAVGTVVDVIIQAEPTAQIVGYEVGAAPALATRGTHVLIPLPDTVAVSGDHLIVPAGALDFVADDLAGFGAAVEGFRARLRR